MATEEMDVEEILRRQDEAMALLERLRRAEPATPPDPHPGGGRREGRRWTAPKSLSVELHDGLAWRAVTCSDLGVGGARMTTLPVWLDGSAPVRLKGQSGPAVLGLADLMWRDARTGTAGLQFEFTDAEERDRWTTLLIDSLLARYALG
jgi:hypothetical protein